jgi:hypothetical protein
MGIASSVLDRLTATPHKAAQGLLDALVQGAAPPLKAYGKYTRAVGKYSGASQLARDTAQGVRHPIARLQGKDAPMRMFNGKLVPMMSGEVPFGPGRAAAGGLARAVDGGRLAERQALRLATPEKLARQRENITSAGVHGEHYGELEVGSRHEAPGRILGDIMRARKGTVVNKIPKENRLGAAEGSPRETFIIDKDGTIIMNPADDWHGVHHPDLMAGHGMISKNWEGDGLPQFLVKERNIIQGEINHSKSMMGGEADRLSVRGWGNTAMNEAQLKTMHEIADEALKKGINLRPPGGAGVRRGATGDNFVSVPRSRTGSSAPRLRGSSALRSGALSNQRDVFKRVFESSAAASRPDRMH